MSKVAEGAETGHSRHSTAAYERPPRSAAVEITTGSLYVIGENVAVDRRTSWIPASASGYQPMNCYLLLDDGHALVVDPGPAVIADSVVSGLSEVLPDGWPTSVFLTRYQLDGIGNLARIAGLHAIAAVHSGGITNPFDSFDQVASINQNVGAPQLELARTGSRLEIGGSLSVEFLSPVLRILTTFWGYEAQTKTLFTSDSFCHTVVSRQGDVPVLDSRANDVTTAEDVRDHLLATFEWLRHADIDPIVANVRAIFEGRDIEVIAPDRGCVLVGADVVTRHYDLVIQALEGIAVGHV